MSEPTSTTSPFVIAASIAVIIASIVGVGSMTGLIPSQSTKPEPAPVVTATAPVTPDPKAETPVQSASTNEKEVIVDKPVAKPAQHVSKPVHKPVHKAATNNLPPLSSQTGYSSRAEPVVSAPVCSSCGTISSIRAVEQAGEGSGLGAIAGGVVGGILGHQVGGGTGKDLATIAGALGGGYAGNQIEKKTKTTKHYEISVRMDNGDIRSFEQDNAPAFVTGEKVKIIDGSLVRN